MQNNLNLHRTLLGIAAVIIILAGVKLAAEIVVPFLLSLFIAIICSPIIKAIDPTPRPALVSHYFAFCLDFFGIFLLSRVD
ncbi:inner membrane protein [Haemophilus influenzae]|uniref:Inner membrane protein n=1 Tax=Haemophilus influenzae TaxID=727 RepID=A0A2X1RIU1_HAEIF|nr:inner membrane protein [Haemophilus influenzae]